MRITVKTNSQGQALIHLSYQKQKYLIPTGIPVTDKEKVTVIKELSRRAAIQLEITDKEISQQSIIDLVEYYRKAADNISLTNGLKNMMDQKKGKITATAIKRYKMLQAKLTDFELYDGKTVYLQDFSRIVFNRFVQWLETIDMNQDSDANVAKLSNMAIVIYIRELKSLLSFLDPDQDWDYIAYNVTCYNVIYLTEDELQQLTQARGLYPYMEKTRDLFLIMVYSGFRYMDLETISPVTFSRKGNLPYSQALKRVLMKYGGYPPGLSQANMNVYLKALFRYLEMDRLIAIERIVDDKKEVTNYPLYEVITTHVARKTFIMNLFEGGYTANEVLSYTGHVDYHSLKPYIRLNQKRAEMLIKQFDQDLFMISPPKEGLMD